MRLTSIIAICALFWPGIVPAADPISLGQFEGHGDVGSPRNAGAASYDAARQEYEIAGSGVNMWGAKDEFHFVWKRLKGDFILRTRFEFVGKGVDPHRKVGWMVRPNLDTDGPYADGTVHGDGLTSLQFRPAKGANTQQILLTVTNADVLQFERKGSTYVFSAARYGEPFVSKELTNFNLGDEVYAGLFVCAHNENVIEKARFRDVRIIRPAKAGFAPYRDFIGSVLEILDVPGGRVEMVHQSRQPTGSRIFPRMANRPPSSVFQRISISGPSLLQAGLLAFDVRGRRDPEGRRVCLWRSGNPERAVLVARQPEARFRQQLRHGPRCQSSLLTPGLTTIVRDAFLELCQ